MAEQEQGWSFVDGAFACAACVEESFLQQWIARNSSEHACSYCARHSVDTAQAVAVNDLFTRIDEGLRIEYDDALNWYPYDSEEKDFVGIRFDSSEVADELGLFSHESLKEQFVKSFESRMFCPANPYGISESEQFMFGWKRFIQHVSHDSRYYFLSNSSDNARDDGYPEEKLSVDEIPAYLGEAVRGLKLVREIGGEATIFRSRLDQSGKVFQGAKQLGAPPPDGARWSNRMSPAGIAMFYGAADEKTAVAEVYESEEDGAQSAKASVGAFKPSRPLRLIDLTGRIDLPSLFDETKCHLREKVRLIHGFTADIAKPIRKDGGEHIEYVPTQIVTEYFRFIFKASHLTPIDGIMYRSSHPGGGICYVLFVDNEHCVDEAPPQSDELYMVLPEGAAHVIGPGLSLWMVDQGIVSPT